MAGAKVHNFQSEPYHFGYSDLSAYARTESLIKDQFRCGEVIVDVGCGFGALAEKCRDAGFSYVGLDIDPIAVKDLVDRGFEAYQCEISGDEAFEQRLREIIADRPTAGFLLLDVLEHLVDAEEVLKLLRSVSTSFGVVPLIVCLPNVTHYDVGAKLVQGLWDETDVGILDHTHVGYYSAEKLDSLARRCGWSESARSDFQLDASDQHFPEDNVALLEGTPLNSVLRHLRGGCREGSDVVQFVRAYVPGPTMLPPSPSRDKEELIPTPFLSVLTRTQGRRLDTLQETFLCLAAQECDDFEVLVLAHNVAPRQTEELRYLVGSLPPATAARFKVIPVTGQGRCRPLNVGVESALGQYVTVLDDDDLVLAHWSAVFKDLAAQWPGRVLRAVVAEQDIARGYWPDRPGYLPTSGFRTPYPSEFDLFDHIVENHTPPCGLAFPRSCFRDLGIVFDESLPVLEDWDVLLQAAFVCGVASSEEVTAIYRRWDVGPSSTSLHTAAEWHGAHQAVIAKLDRRASVFPPGAITRVRQLQGELNTARAEIERYREMYLTAVREPHQVKELYEKSTSWRVTKPLRGLSSSVKAFRERRA